MTRIAVFLTRSRISWIIVAMLFVIAVPDSIYACPTCGESIDEQHSIGFGYAVSILFMMSVPYMIIAWWAYICLRIVRTRREMVAAGARIPA